MLIIALTRAWDAERVAEEIGAAHRVIISDPRHDALFPGTHRDGDHLHLAFHDAVEQTTDRVLATEDQIATLIDFVHIWGGKENLVFNCYGGRSRSSASLIIALTALHPGRERRIVEMVSASAPHAAPNQHVVALGDRLLGCNGRLIAAVKAMPEPMRGFTGTAFFDTHKLANILY